MCVQTRKVVSTGTYDTASTGLIELQDTETG